MSLFPVICKSWLQLNLTAFLSSLLLDLVLRLIFWYLDRPSPWYWALHGTELQIESKPLLSSSPSRCEKRVPLHYWGCCHGDTPPIQSLNYLLWTELLNTNTFHIASLQSENCQFHTAKTERLGVEYNKRKSYMGIYCMDNDCGLYDLLASGMLCVNMHS